MHARIFADAPPTIDEQEVAECSPLAPLFDELDGRGWPLPLLECRLAALLEHASCLAPEDRCAWLAGLHGAWRRQGWALGTDGRRALLHLAELWCAWPLAHAVGSALHADRLLDGKDALRLVDACRHLGDVELALDLVVGLQLRHPSDECYADAYRALLAWSRWRDAQPVVDGADWDVSELRLEPLAHHHLPDFAWQYHDPAIAELCCLPVFQEDAHWHAWLDTIHAAGDQHMFAVLHREWGFIGSVSLILSRDVGFFYYWIGHDFQGHGLGPQAVSLMLAMAQRDLGMRCCYAKVFDRNLPSRRALEKLGFISLGIHGAAPDDDQLFYRWGEEIPEDQLIGQLHTLLECVDSSTRAGIPLRSSTA